MDPNMSSGMYWESFENAPADQFNTGVPFNQPPQYQQGDQFIATTFSQIPPIHDQEMPMQDTLQDSNMFQMATQNPIPFQDQIQPVPMEESVSQTPIPQAGVNDQVPPERPETPGSNVRITRSRLRGAQPGAVSATTTYTSKRPPPEERARRTGRPAAVRKQFQEDENAVSQKDACLYDLVRNGKSSLTTLVDEWIDEYKVNRDTALLALMQFFINASGCKGKITSAMAANMEHAAIIRKMTEEFDEESGEYPFIMSGPQWKKFRQNFCDFIAILVKQCQYSIIYDQYLMDNVISLLTGLSDSQVRAFRHTATLAAMKLMTALVEVALLVSINLDNTQRQYEAERQKNRERRASDRLESLMSKRQELEENMDEIKNMLTYLFKSVFVHRYRDTLPEIRAICMAEIGVWMKKFHQNFLDDSYLKYIGWTLHDKVGEVRLKCLQALQPLYASEELKGKLELFTSKFKDRIVAMTLDKEYEVAVQAVKLVISILKNHKDILTDKDCEHVYELVYSSHRAVAQAAGEFLNERLFVQDELMQDTRTKRGKKRLPNTPLIRDLVQFFIESELHEHGAYLVDSLIESNDMMKDWECMTDLLLEEPGPNEEALDDRQETSLIELMTCCVRQAATGEAPVGRGSNRKIASVKEIKQVQEDKAKLTEHFIKTLPLLLDKYRADADKLVNLLSFPQYFELDMYVKSRQESNLELLLKKKQVIADKHQGTEVLETCAKTLEVLCNENNAIFSTKCDVHRSTLIDNIVKKYREAMDDWNAVIESGEEPDDDEMFQVITSMKKISIFYACHNLGHWNIWLVVFNDFRNAISGQKYLPPEVIKSSVWACYYGIMWDLHHLEDLAENGNSENITNLVREVKSRLSQLMEMYKEMLLHENSMFREEAYVAICDLLIVFCNQLNVNPYKVLAELVYEPDRELQKMLNDFIQGNVFVYEEEEENDDHSRIEALHKRRNFLASYCKLIVYSIMPTSCAADVFKHYVKSYNEYGDIIKATVAKARELNKVNCARTMVSSLISLFKELQDENGGLIISRNSNQFSSLKELAKRFALSFGLDALKNREAITVLHREGVLFAVSETFDDPTSAPPNLPFLEILMEFTNKLLKQDKRMILNYLDRRVSCGMPSSKGEDWQPLLLYRNSLLHGESDQPLPTARRAYTRKKKEVDDEMGEEEEQISDQEYGDNAVEGIKHVYKKKVKTPKSCYKSEVKSKIGDYIRGKISAQSLMHPSRVNTKPIDKRKYNLHSGIHYETTRTDYQKKIRRPPLKDYIEGKVKLCDMISPSKITYIPKERKYQNLLPPNDGMREEPRHRTMSFAESIETINIQSGTSSISGGYGGASTTKFKDEWDMAKCHATLSKTVSSSSNGMGNSNEYSLVPIRSTGSGPAGKRKLMCKIKVQRSDNTQNGGTETKTEEHIIEIPEKILRRGHHSLPKFLMDRYNIPCYVNGAAGGGSAGKQQSRRRQPLSILDGTSSEPNAVTNVEFVTPPPPPQSSSRLRSPPANRAAKAQAIEYPVADGENAIGHVDVNTDSSKNINTDVDNLPSEQGDYNNATTYVFEFYEEEVPQETKSAIIEEIEDDHSHRDYAKSYTEDARFNRHTFNDSLRSDEFQHYEDFKSNIYVQRELMDLHRGMLKCDKNFMVVEHNVNQMMASLNMLETVQNQEIKPSVLNIKMDNEKMRHQLQTLATENEELKKSVQYLKKKTTDYDKVIYYIRHDSNMKIQELENKLETITQTHIKSIEMQNTVNKNIMQITHGMKRVYNEQDSKHCCNSIKSPKNSNLTIS